MVKIRCGACGEILESLYLHHFVQCGCDNETFIDGGEFYTRCGGKSLNKILFWNDKLQVFGPSYQGLACPRVRVTRTTFLPSGVACRESFVIPLGHLDPEELNVRFLFEDEHQIGTVDRIVIEDQEGRVISTFEIHDLLI